MSHEFQENPNSCALNFIYDDEEDDDNLSSSDEDEDGKF